MFLKVRRSWLNSRRSICGEMLGPAARSGTRSVQTATSPSTFGFYSGELSWTCSDFGHLRCHFAISLMFPAVMSCCGYSLRVRCSASRSHPIFGHNRKLYISLLDVLTTVRLVSLQHTNTYLCPVSDSNGLHEVRLWGIAI